MNKWDPTIVRGHHVLQLLSTIRTDTLYQVRSDLGEMTFVNADLIRIVEKEFANREKRTIMASKDTLEIDEPDFEFLD